MLSALLHLGEWVTVEISQRIGAVFRSIFSLSFSSMLIVSCGKVQTFASACVKSGLGELDTNPD
jgi:hypothetical protein